MTCPHYDPNNRTCGLKSEYYGELPLQTITNYCTSDYASCGILKSELERKKSEVEERIRKIEETQKVSLELMKKVITI